ncbi:hypothetical protein GCM10025787_10600 [Saccharopolyspora rosea]
MVGVRGGVEGDRAVAGFSGQGSLGFGDQGGEFGGQVAVGGFGFAVHPGDGGSGQDVVELVQQQVFPQPVEGVVGVVASGVDGGGGGPELGFAEQVFVAAVALFGLGLGGVGAAVFFEVELAGPDRGVAVVGFGGGEEGFGGVELNAG